MELPRISASKLKTYLSCKNRYVYQYVQHIKSEKNIYSILGTAFHKAVELCYREDLEPIAVYEAIWYDELDKAKLQHNQIMFDEGLNMLNIYDFNLRRPYLLEYEFELPYPIENPKYTFVGFIDHIYNDNVIVDLKTSKTKPSKTKLSTDPQFIIYREVYKNIFQQDPQVFWYHARTADYVEVKPIENMTLDHYFPIIEEMLKTDTLVEKDDLCYFCPNISQCAQLGTRKESTWQLT